MASFLPENAGRILEPTPGAGNLLKQLVANHKNVVAPEDFFSLDIKTERFDWIVSNVPFSPMKLGYKILFDCMERSDNTIALMPWLTLINGEKRFRDIMRFGLISVTNLPRKTFKGSRVQCCILEMKKGYI